jgi:hypothetical protein
MLDMSTLGDVVYVNPVIKFLPHTLQHLAVDGSDCLHDPLLQLCCCLAVAAIDHQVL